MRVTAPSATNPYDSPDPLRPAPPDDLLLMLDVRHLQEPGEPAVRGDRRSGADLPAVANRRRLAVPVDRRDIPDAPARIDLVVLDELGYLPFAQSGGPLLFHLISQLR